MPPESPRSTLSWWCNLMSATGHMLLVAGVPGAVIFLFLLSRDPSAHVDGSDALVYGFYLVGIEGLVACTLLLAAGWIRKRHFPTRPT